MGTIIDVNASEPTGRETTTTRGPEQDRRAPMIRRSPQTDEPVPAQLQGGRISMTLDDWLHVDRTLHELRNLVEIAIMQRDQAQQAAKDEQHLRQADETERDRLRENIHQWKDYAESLEKKLRQSYLRELDSEFMIRRLSDLTEESLLLGPFSAKRRKVLSKRLVDIHRNR